MDKKCAPNKNYNEGTCFTLNNLINIGIHINKKFPDQKIKLVNNKRELLKALTSFMKEKYNCNDQICWLKTDILEEMDNEDINYFTFRPDGPEKKRDWLSTTDINNVMNQYEKKYSDFKFFGAVPYDFDDLSFLEVSNVNFNKLMGQNKNQLGMVVNLDKHNMKGSHWVGLYVNLKKNQIYFFDSFAKIPGDLIKKFIGKCLQFMYKNKYNKRVTLQDINDDNANLKEFDIRYNKIRHQFKNSECGVYSMNFIIRLLNGETFNAITQNITKDDDMNECRKVYFNNAND